MNIWKYIGEKIEVPIDSNLKVLTKTPEFLLENCAKIISAKLGKRVEIDILTRYSKEAFENTKEVKICVGREFDFDTLPMLGFTKVNRVWNANEYGILGDVVIFWPEGEEDVLRVSLFDGKVEKISFLDSQTRRYKKDLDSYKFFKKEDDVRARILSGSQDLDTLRFLFFREEIDNENIQYEKIDIGLRPFPNVNSKQVEKIIDSYRIQGFEIFTPDKSLEYINGVVKIEENIERGFVISKSKIVVVTEFEFLGKIDLSNVKTKNEGDGIFKQIVKGDYIVHEDHGIGIYEDLIYQNGKSYLEVHYSGKDRLLVPLTSASKLTKYVGAGKGKPRLTGLNSGVWTRIKNRASEDIKKLAKELIRLYAMRSLIKRKPFVKNNEEVEGLNKFVSTFKYPDTEDQQVITQEILSDFKDEKPMDRLIVGDVGFGKTELAARAIYLAVNSGHQVALLTPTTILSSQHYLVFKERFKNYPFKIVLLNRYITGIEREGILSDIKTGRADIVIGTHALLSNEIEMPNLGLLVIDEEQKFGVSQKEKLKNKRLEVDVLSITATPIPRTLNMAISGIRDLSILASVPLGRKPIENTFSVFDINLIKTAITKEVSRGGQIYYMHNRVKELPVIMEKLKKQLPDISFGIAHGQMGETQINNVMSDFLQNKINVLICSSIIENGLDIPNVNTIIIDDAQRYGLSSLYQIRGRVGRSDRQAYAYIMYSTLKGRANLRLDALYEASNIGAGFVLSNRDLEIRGSGNILGKSQSGAIDSIGYALYTQILNEAVRKLQGNNY